ncbi:hypothetical protein [Mumia sp. DW29H23]|uniref:hypothetical protein n=1 Tax=Mumia sp. DW29H23 TaxID=3421241 RepID=UPI003D69DD32
MTDTQASLDEPIHSQADLHARWAALMGELGFSRRALWCALVDPDRRMVPHVTQIDDVPVRADLEQVAGFLGTWRHILDGSEPGTTVALLLSRPGRAGMDESDRTWARTLATTARYLRVPLETIHLATDAELVAFAPDDLAS